MEYTVYGLCNTLAQQRGNMTKLELLTYQSLLRTIQSEMDLLCYHFRKQLNGNEGTDIRGETEDT